MEETTSHTHYSFGQLHIDPERGRGMAIVHLWKDGVISDRAVEFGWDELEKLVGKGGKRRIEAAFDLIAVAALKKAGVSNRARPHPSLIAVRKARRPWWRFWS